MKTKILIEVTGGIVQRVLANQDADIVIVDIDYDNVNPYHITPVQGPDLINKGRDIHELFTNPSEAEVREELKRLKF